MPGIVVEYTPILTEARGYILSAAGDIVCCAITYEIFPFVIITIPVQIINKIIIPVQLINRITIPVQLINQIDVSTIMD